MIINCKAYRCISCKSLEWIDEGAEIPQICKKCGDKLEFERDFTRDTELARQYREEHTIKCTYCKSTNITKISAISRSLSFGLLGFGSSKVGKQWHCNSCGSDF